MTAFEIWINAFIIYVDEDARNLAVSNRRVEYTIRRLERGAWHGFTVLTSNDAVVTTEQLSGRYLWPNPHWTVHTVQ